LKKFPSSEDTKREFIQTQLDELESRDSRNRRKTAATARTGKTTGVRQEKLETKLQLLVAEEKKDNTLTFEELGIDRLFVDEAHFFKKPLPDQHPLCPLHQCGRS